MMHVGVGVRLHVILSAAVLVHEASRLPGTTGIMCSVCVCVCVFFFVCVRV